jgi:hypothetical protein
MTMSKSLHSLFAAALIAGGALVAVVSPAVAQSYPRVTGSGEQLMIDYGPMGQGNLVGGGRVMVTQPTGMDIEVMHLDTLFVQAPRPGFVPLVVGENENRMVVYVPQAMVDQLRAARAAPRR